MTDIEVTRFAELVNRNVSEFKETYEYGLYVALQAVLVSPDFLFRKEADPEGDATERQLNEYEVASRLSYFLWSSMPDEELFAPGREQDPARFTAFLPHRFTACCRTKKPMHSAATSPHSGLTFAILLTFDRIAKFSRTLTANFALAMGQETEMFFRAIVNEDRSIDEFLNADFHFPQ